MEEFNIRRAVEADLPTLYAFEQGIIEAERPYDPTLKSGHINYYDLASMISQADACVLLATVGDKIIGSAYGLIKEAKPYLKHEQYTYMGFMFVNEAFRGKGVNSKIIEALFKWSKSKGINECRLDVYQDNPSAIRAYEKVGFTKHLINMRIEI